MVVDARRQRRLEKQRRALRYARSTRLSSARGISNLVSGRCDQYSRAPISGCVVLIGRFRFATFVLNVFSHSD
jgi:hypothetical protein